jgi:hypothetical protein
MALLEELRVSVQLLEAGIQALHAINFANDEYYVPLMLLASGLERFMKAILAYASLAHHGRLPGKGDIPQTHDLEELLALIVDRDWPPAYTSRPAAQEDLRYLREDQGLNSLIEALSDFADARRGRYYNLEITLGEDPAWDSPEQAWSRLEMAILREHPRFSEWIDSASPADIFSEINRVLVYRLERMLRALSRLFTLGALGDEAARATGLVNPFLFLLDDDLGERRD